MELVLLVTLICAWLPVLSCSRQKRMTGANEAKPHSRPYQVLNMHVLKDGNVELCGGALISKSFVLTAAYCFKNLENLNYTEVVMGAHNLNEEKTVQIADSFTVHEQFKFELAFYVNDIALLKLPKPVELTKNIQLVNLPRRSQVNESLHNIKASIAGWGATETNKRSDVLLEGISTVLIGGTFCNSSSPIICAIPTQGQPESGDTGSPMVVDNTVIGVISTGFWYKIYLASKINRYLDWIEQHSDVKILD